MKRKEIRSIINIVSLFFTLLAIGTYAQYVYANIGYYKNIFHTKDLFNMVNLTVYSTLCVFLFLYTIIRTIKVLRTSEKVYFERTREASFPHLFIHIAIDTVIVFYLGFATVTLKIYISTVSLIVGVMLLMFSTIIYYMDILMPNYVKDEIRKRLEDRR